MLRNVKAMLKDDSGQGLVEYGLILFFVSVVAITALSLLGTNITAVLTKVAGDI